VPVLEISDLIAAWHPIMGERLPVVKDEVVARLREAGDRRAARIVERMPGCARRWGGMTESPPRGAGRARS